MLTPYTTNPQVRAVFGVTEEELPDSVLDLPLYEANLRLELRAIGVSLPADFKTLSAAPGVPADAEKDLIDAVTLFAPYAVGLQLTAALPLFATKAVTDGKAGVTRHADSPFEAQIKECKRKYEVYRQNLENTYATFASTATPTHTDLPALFAISNPDSDPVIGT